MGSRAPRRELRWEGVARGAAPLAVETWRRAPVGAHLLEDLDGGCPPPQPPRSVKRPGSARGRGAGAWWLGTVQGRRLSFLCGGSFVAVPVGDSVQAAPRGGSGVVRGSCARSGSLHAPCSRSAPGSSRTRNVGTGVGRGRGGPPAAPLRGSSALAEATRVDFARRVRPILAEHCFACHSPTPPLGGPAARPRGGRHPRPGRLRRHRSEATARASCSAAARGRVLGECPPRASPPDEEEAVLGGGSPRGRLGTTGLPLASLTAVPGGSERARPDRRPRRARLAEGLTPAPEADRHPPPPRDPRPHGAPADAGEIDAFVSDGGPAPTAGSSTGCWRPALRGADGAPVARRGPLRGHEQVLHRRRPAHVGLAGLGHRGVQREHALRRFTVEQLAGDLLPDADDSTRIASGFNRNHMNTHEAGPSRRSTSWSTPPTGWRPRPRRPG